MKQAVSINLVKPMYGSKLQMNKPMPQTTDEKLEQYAVALTVHAALLVMELETLDHLVDEEPLCRHDFQRRTKEYRKWVAKEIDRLYDRVYANKDDPREVTESYQATAGQIGKFMAKMLTLPAGKWGEAMLALEGIADGTIVYVDEKPDLCQTM